MKYIQLLFSVLLIPFALSAQQGGQNEGSFSGSVIQKVSSDYLLYLPDGFNEVADKKWPLLVFLHGSGERGHDLEKVKVHGPPRLIAEGRTFPMVVLSPQCPDSTDWDNETLFALIRHIATRYRIDESMVYLTGLSMGGTATWDMAIAYPGYFAAIAPVCGRVSRNAPHRAAGIKSLPIWAFHGAADDVVPVIEPTGMIKALRKYGNEVRFTIYPLAGHDCWTETYNNPELYEWFLSNKRKQPYSEK